MIAPLTVGAAKRIVYLGTPEIAVAPLRGLIAAGKNVELVITRPDVRRSRGNKPSPSPVKLAAIELGIPVVESLASLPDLISKHELQDALGVVVAYGELISKQVLAAVPMINIHFSLLPRWRGAAPVERAILAGDEVTGVCIMRVVEALDQGEVYSRQQIPIDEFDTAGSLRQKLVQISVPMLLDVISNGCGVGVPQSGEVTYAKKITNQDLRIDWQDSAQQILRLVRIGGAFSTFGGKRVRIISAKPTLDNDQRPIGSVALSATNVCQVSTRIGSLILETIQVEGKSKVNALAWWNGLSEKNLAKFV